MSDSPSIIIRAIWFLLVGWWLTGIILGAAWLLNLTVIGIPLGIKLVNYAPKALSLKDISSSDDVDEVVVGGNAESDTPSVPIRAVWFLFIGWWASGILMVFAYLLSLSIIGLPFAIMLFNRLPWVVSLYKG